VKRAVELFAFEDLGSGSDHVSLAWRTSSDPPPGERFLSVAVAQWEMVVTRQAGQTTLTVRGPETTASVAPIPPDAEFLGIQFRLGTYPRWLDMRRLVDSAVTLPTASRGARRPAIRLDGASFELPSPHDVDVFVDRLARAGLLVHDPVVSAALAGDLAGLSRRSVERRVARATGLTRGTIRQIRRAERAVDLLDRGVPPLEVARRAGYADQPHLTRSLKRFVGQTPSQAAAPGP
jgi:AraC-like DNA-binding protein